MIVCDECAKLGKIQKHLQNQNLENQTNLRKIKQQNKIILKMNLKKNWLKILMLKLEKPENLKPIKRGIRSKIYEKVSVINRIESGKMIPDIRLTKKLENALNITLIENVEELDLSKYTGNPSRGRTLGNVVKIKKGSYLFE